MNRQGYVYLFLVVFAGLLQSEASAIVRDVDETLHQVVRVALSHADTMLHRYTHKNDFRTLASSCDNLSSGDGANAQPDCDGV